MKLYDKVVPQELKEAIREAKIIEKEKQRLRVKKWKMRNKEYIAKMARIYRKRKKEHTTPKQKQLKIEIKGLNKKLLSMKIKNILKEL